MPGARRRRRPSLRGRHLQSRSTLSRRRRGRARAAALRALPGARRELELGRAGAARAPALPNDAAGARGALSELLFFRFEKRGERGPRQRAHLRLVGLGVAEIGETHIRTAKLRAGEIRTLKI